MTKHLEDAKDIIGRVAKRRKGRTAVFCMPTGTVKIVPVASERFPVLYNSYQHLLVGVYSHRCPPEWLAEDLSEFENRKKMRSMSQ